SHADRQLGVELAHDVAGGGLEQLELQAAPEASLVDIDQQRIHLRLVRQLAQQRAELHVDLAQLLAVQIEVDRLALLVEVLLLQPVFLLVAGLESVDLPGGVGEVAADRDGHQDGEQHQRLRRGVPGSRIVPVGVLEIFDEGVEIEGHGYFFAAPGAAGVAAGAGSTARFRKRNMLNSETRFLSTLDALTSTSTGLSSHGEESMLRISVETRAFDCA